MDPSQHTAPWSLGLLWHWSETQNWDQPEISLVRHAPQLLTSACLEVTSMWTDTQFQQVTHTHAHKHMHMYTNSHTCPHTQTHKHPHAKTHTCPQTQTHAHTHPHAHQHPHKHLQTHIMYAHTPTPTYTLNSLQQVDSGSVLDEGHHDDIISQDDV